MPCHGLTSIALLLLATIVLPSTAAARDGCMVVTGATGWVASHVVNDALSVRPPGPSLSPLTHSLRSSALSHSPHPLPSFVPFRPPHSTRSLATPPLHSFAPSALITALITAHPLAARAHRTRYRAGPHRHEEGDAYRHMCTMRDPTDSKGAERRKD